MLEVPCRKGEGLRTTGPEQFGGYDPPEQDGAGTPMAGCDEWLFNTCLSNSIPGIVAVGGFDAVTHITDEVEAPTKQAP